MSEQNKNNKLKIVISDPISRGSERKQRRLAGAIAMPEPSRPRLPVQSDTAKIFDMPAWRERWGTIRAVAETTNLYIAGCSGSMALAGILGMPILKPGTAQDVGARIRKLNRENYGSMTIRDFSIIDERGWSDWEPAKLSCRPTHPASPVRILPRQIAIDLPFWIGPQDFEALVVAALEPITLASIVGGPGGRSLCKSRGCTADTLLRYSRGVHGPVLATEIGVIAPSGDAGRLVTLLEWIVVRLVVADDGWEG